MFTSPTTPMRHQLEADARLQQQPKIFAVLAETGTGKSFIILQEYQRRAAANEIKYLLVLAPNGSIRSWYTDKADTQPSELNKHLDPAFRKQLHVAVWGKSTRHKASLTRLETVQQEGKPAALFINIEAFSGNARTAENVAAKFLRAGHAMFVVDESTKIRSSSARRTKAVMRLAPLAASRRIMTGFVTPKSPMDLYNQFKFLDPLILGHSTFTSFRARYADVRYECYQPTEVIRARLQAHINRRKQTFSTVGLTRQQMLDTLVRLGGYIQMVPKIEGFKNLEELKHKIEPYSYQVLKKDCLDLPPKVYEPRDIELTEEQRYLYSEMKANATAQLRDTGHITAETVLAQMMKLHQIVCGHVKNELNELTNIPSNRVETILEVLEEHSGKAIIWTCYDPELRKIIEAVKKEYGASAVAAYWGGNRAIRDEEEKRFLGDSACRFMVSTQATGGMGNTWTVATLSVYAASNYDLELRFQSEDRNHRKGQHESVTYVDLIARGTVEERILYALRNKINLASAVTGRNFEQWLV